MNLKASRFPTLQPIERLGQDVMITGVPTPGTLRPNLLQRLPRPTARFGAEEQANSGVAYTGRVDNGDGGGGEDNALATRAQQGDKVALCQMLEARRGIITGVLVKRQHMAPDKVADGLQETAVHIMEGTYRPRTGESVTDFLLRAAMGSMVRLRTAGKKDDACGRLYGQGRDRQGHNGDQYNYDVDEGPGNNPRDNAALRELVALIDKRLGEMKLEVAQVTRMAVLEGMDNREIGDRLGYSQPKVASSKRIGMLALGRYLKQLGIDPPAQFTRHERLVAEHDGYTRAAVSKVPEALAAYVTQAIKETAPLLEGEIPARITPFMEAPVDQKYLGQLITLMRENSPDLADEPLTHHVAGHLQVMHPRNRMMALLRLVGQTAATIGAIFDLNPATVSTDVILPFQKNITRCPPFSEPTGPVAAQPLVEAAPPGQVLVLHHASLIGLLKHAKESATGMNRVAGILAAQFADYYRKRLPAVNPDHITHFAHLVTQRLTPLQMLSLFARVNGLSFPIIQQQLGYTSERRIKTIVKEGHALFSQSFGPLMAQHGVPEPPQGRLQNPSPITLDAFYADPENERQLAQMKGGLGAIDALIEPFVMRNRKHLINFLKANTWAIGSAGPDDEAQAYQPLVEGMLRTFKEIRGTYRSPLPLMLTFMGLPPDEILKVIDTTPSQIRWNVNTFITTAEKNTGTALGRQHVFTGTAFYDEDKQAKLLQRGKLRKARQQKKSEPPPPNPEVVRVEVAPDVLSTTIDTAIVHPLPLTEKVGFNGSFDVQDVKTPKMLEHTPAPNGDEAGKADSQSGA